MDGSGFDAWTRRRFGLAAGGLAASVAAMAGLGDARAAKKKKKKGTNCCLRGKNCGTPGTTDKKCCTNFRCSNNPEECFCKSANQPCMFNVQSCSNKCLSTGCA
jgi:hypothetical protein